MRESDRFRQEMLFQQTFKECQPEKTQEQNEILTALYNKQRNIIRGRPLDGSEPYLTFEEFSEWGIRNPID